MPNNYYERTAEIKNCTLWDKTRLNNSTLRRNYTVTVGDFSQVYHKFHLFQVNSWVVLPDSVECVHINPLTIHSATSAHQAWQKNIYCLTQFNTFSFEHSGLIQGP